MKKALSLIAAILVAILFLAAGLWKMTHPFDFAQMAEQLRVPFRFSMPLTLVLATFETLAGVLILIPRFRRWGATLAGLLLVAFMIYIGANYQTLLGKDCSCFPWVRRSIGPNFFIGDAAMLLAALVAGVLAQRSRSMRGAIAILALAALGAGAGYGAAVMHQTGLKAPDTITVDGKSQSLQHGRIFLFFYDPQCSHCDEAARHMSKYHWKDDVQVIGIPVAEPRWAASFLHDTGLKAGTSLDLALLKKTFTFGDPPYGVALVNGHEVAPVPHYDEPEPGDTLRKLGFIE